MKVAQWDPEQKKAVVNEVLIPEPDHNQFLVGMGSASLCHSDLMSMAMDHKGLIIIGYEGAGYVHNIHPSAEGKGFKVGDAIGFTYIIDCCFECEGCKIHNNHCLVQESHTQGFTAPGLFAEYALVDWHSAILLPGMLPVRTASPMFCAGITTFHCVDSCELKPRQWLVIIGCGGLGQLATQYAEAMGFKVVGVDINDDVLATVFNSCINLNYIEEVRNFMDRGPKKGAGAVAVFSAADAAYRSAPPLVKLGGFIMVVRLPANGVTFNALDIARGTYKVKGDSTRIPERMKKAISFTAKHNIKPEVEIFSSLESVNGMVEMMKKELSTKRMVVSFA
ncbi:GroES-like protein [Glonium stellatum]|uniref:GroES-like protein n=1 Tax=Glonium stellatum TaxID=574774 RepID=A0A8E2EPL1_9PEZI|nr:GroES-like protein [Glonium stellatum]